MGDIIKHPSSETPWGLDEDKDRVRYFYKKEDQRTHVNFKAPTHLIRQIDEVVAARLDPRLKTRSDALCEAVAMFCSVYDNGSPEIEVMARAARMDSMIRKQEYYQRMLDDAEKAANQAASHKNISMLRVIQTTLYRNKQSFVDMGSQKMVKQLEELIDRVKQYLAGDSDRSQ
jgi:hypothetical protein